MNDELKMVVNAIIEEISKTGERIDQLEEGHLR